MTIQNHDLAIAAVRVRAAVFVHGLLSALPDDKSRKRAVQGLFDAAPARERPLAAEHVAITITGPAVLPKRKNIAKTVAEAPTVTRTLPAPEIPSWRKVSAGFIPLPGSAAASIMKALEPKGSSYTKAQLCKATGVKSPTLFSALRTLQKHGYVACTTAIINGRPYDSYHRKIH